MKMIYVEFIGGKRVVYTKDVLRLLMNDDEVLHILDLDTGELLK